MEINGGTRAGHLVDKQASDWIGYILGGAFALLGLALLISAGIVLRRPTHMPASGAAL
jgi:hypothetical protein